MSSHWDGTLLKSRAQRRWSTSNFRVGTSVLLATDPWLSDVANWIKAFHTHFFLEALFLYADICIHKTRILSIYIVDRSSVVWLYLLNKIDMNISSVQFSSSVVSDFLRPHESQHARPPCPSPTPGVSLRLTSIESVMPSSHLILCRPLLLLPPIHPSIRVFSNESTLLMRWPKDWSFSFSIILSKEIPGLISFRMDWLDLLAV